MIYKQGIGDLPYTLSNEMRGAFRKLPWALRAITYRGLKANPWKTVPEDKDFLFIHIPKTGGTAVTNALGLDAGWHPKLEEFFACDPVRAAEAFKFAFVRNPWDRLVSSFHYTVERSDSLAEIKWRDHWFSGCHDFECFLRRLGGSYRFRRAVLLHPMFEPQLNFVIHKNKLALDFLGRQESFCSDLLEVAKRIRLPDPSIDRHNTSRRGHYKKYYSEEWQIDLVWDMYGGDARAFGYVFS